MDRCVSPRFRPAAVTWLKREAHLRATPMRGRHHRGDPERSHRGLEVVIRHCLRLGPAQRGFRGLGVGRLHQAISGSAPAVRRNGASAVSVLAGGKIGVRCAGAGAGAQRGFRGVGVGRSGAQPVPPSASRRNGASAVSVLAVGCSLVTAGKRIEAQRGFRGLGVGRRRS